MTLFLGVDGGGTKTALCLVSGAGELISTHHTRESYRAGPPGVGPRHVAEVLGEAIPTLCGKTGLTANMIDFAFIGLPAYGELNADQALLDAVPRDILGHDRYLVDNDVVCGWAGSLALADGINVVAGTGSIAYGRNGDAAARVGGWGELFGDECSGYWMGLRALQAFSQMSDGRLPWTALGDLFKERLGLDEDFDVLDVVLHRWDSDRGRIAGLSRLIAEAAEAGDPNAAKILDDGVDELVRHVTATRDRVGFDPDASVPVSYSGGVFNIDRVRGRFVGKLTAGAYDVREPRYEPLIGAALYAAKLSGSPLDDSAMRRLADQFR